MYLVGKIFFILFFIPFVALANIVDVQNYYDAKEYQNAIAEAELSSQDFSNPELHLLWAKSAEALGDAKEAMTAYERVIMLDEENLEARLALVNLYKKTKRYSLANIQAQDLQNYQLSPEQRTALEGLQDVSLQTIKARANLAFGYDTNINILPDKLLSVDQNITQISTAFSRLNGSVSYINDLKGKNDWYAQADLKFYNQRNFEDKAKFYDLLMLNGSGGIGYKNMNYNLYIPLSYEYVHYLDDDLYTEFKLQPRVNIALSKKFILNFHMDYAQRKYELDIQRDDVKYGLGSGIYYIENKNYYYLNMTYDSYSAKNNLHKIYVDKNYFISKLGVNYKVSDFFVTKVDYRFRFAKYEDKSSSDEIREDYFNQVELKLSHFFKNYFEVYLSNRYVKNFSNLNASKYDKNIAMLGLSVNY